MSLFKKKKKAENLRLVAPPPKILKETKNFRLVHKFYANSDSIVDWLILEYRAENAMEEPFFRECYKDNNGEYTCYMAFLRECYLTEEKKNG